MFCCIFYISIFKILPILTWKVLMGFWNKPTYLFERQSLKNYSNKNSVIRTKILYNLILIEQLIFKIYCVNNSL
jgi:hypothetical protein